MSLYTCSVCSLSALQPTNVGEQQCYQAVRAHHVMESNRPVFCFRSQTGLVATQRSTRQSPLEARNMKSARSLAGSMAERKPENQKSSTSVATNLHRRAHWARSGGARPRHQNALLVTPIICNGRNTSNRRTACVHCALHLVPP